MQTDAEVKNEELTREEIHAELLGMLDSFKHYCEARSLRYYPVGGTLLGAVRHGGFIPWDDDIDVGMPRPDYERFLSYTRTEPVRDDLRVCSDEDGTLSMPYAQLQHNRIVLEKPTSAYIDKNYQLLHLFVDILPQDGWPADDSKARRLAFGMKILRRLNTYSRARAFRGATKLRGLLKTPFIFIAKIIGNKTILSWMQHIAKAYPFDKCKYVGCITYGIYGAGERRVRKNVIRFGKISFEGLELCAPGDTDAYLKGLYGNYMELPPESKRKNHGLRAWRV